MDYGTVRTTCIAILSEVMFANEGLMISTLTANSNRRRNAESPTDTLLACAQLSRTCLL